MTAPISPSFGDVAGRDVGDDLDAYLAEELDAPQFRDAYEDALAREVLVRSLLDVRRERQLTQKTVAERMGTTQSAVSELEGGLTDARFTTLQRYARALQCRLAAWVLPEGCSVDGAFAAFVGSERHRLEASVGHWRGAALGFDGRPVMRLVAIAPLTGAPARMYFAGCVTMTGQQLTEAAGDLSGPGEAQDERPPIIQISAVSA